MSSIRLPRMGQGTVFWSVFCGVCLLVAVLAVLGLRPRSPIRLAPHPVRGAGEARMGKMILDDGSDECEQISFNNDTAEITGTGIVPCAPRKRGKTPAAAPSPSANQGAGDMLGSMRKAFKGEDR